MLYQELLDSCRDRFDAFFQNVPLFDNHFRWSAYNEVCYRFMYSENREDCIATVKELKETIPELTDLCKQCSAFFVPARNKSIPKYDVIMGQQHEDVLMNFLKKKLDTEVCRADLENRSMPDCKVLRPDGTVAAYFEVKFHGAPFVYALKKTGRFCYEGSATLDHKKIENQLEIIEGLNAPTFYVHWIEYPCLKGIFYEPSDQVKHYIAQQHETFEREKREGDAQKSEKAIYLKKMYSPLLKMKDFEAFIRELRLLIDQ